MHNEVQRRASQNFSLFPLLANPDPKLNSSKRPPKGPYVIQRHTPSNSAGGLVKPAGTEEKKKAEYAGGQKQTAVAAEYQPGIFVGSSDR